MSTIKIIKVNATKSTNDKVKMLIKSKKINDWTIISANYQYGGRGQRMNKWYSSYGKNLLCSLFYKPCGIKSDRTFLINQAVSLAVLKTIRKFNNEKCLIKGPNDILSVNKKIAGILVENSLSSDKVKHSIIGVGININQVFFKSLPNATSIKKVSNKNIVVENVLKELIDSYKYYFTKINDIKYINDEYNQNIYGKEGCKFILNGKKFNGKIISISNTGVIKLNKDSQEIGNYDSRKVKLLYD